VTDTSAEFNIDFKSNGVAFVNYPEREPTPLASYNFVAINDMGSDNIEVLHASKDPSYDLVLAWYNLSPLGKIIEHLVTEAGSLEGLKDDFGKVFAPPVVV
jgi:hypothetical protein